jgi:small subunit ribosomal protein S8
MDTVADSLIRIKNGYLSFKNEVVLPYSNLVKAICEVLKKEGYISEFKEIPAPHNEKIRQITVTLKYDSESDMTARKKPALSEVKRISKPGLRVYKNKKMIPYVLNGLGIAIISTPKGVMTDKQARKEGVGGEILAYVW